MIIKYGVGDNDFQNFLRRFGNCISPYLRNFKYVEMREALKNNDIKLYCKLDQEREEFLKAINVNNDEPLSKETKDKICQYLTECFKKKVVNLDGMSDFDDKTIDYLVKNFTVEVVDCIRDEWANGEDNYYIQSNNVVITL